MNREVKRKEKKIKGNAYINERRENEKETKFEGKEKVRE